MRYCILTLSLFVLSASLSAGEFNKTLSLGDDAPAWADLPGTDGKKHALGDLKDKDLVVVVFTCNSCACAQEYEDRIVAFAQAHGDRVGVVAINVSLLAEDRLDAMKKKAVKKKFTFPYLYDETQKIAQSYGATYTPEFFVLTKDRKVAYMGSMDDKTNVNDVKDKYLESAIAAVLNGATPAKGETPSRGCRIKYKRNDD